MRASGRGSCHSGVMDIARLLGFVMLYLAALMRVENAVLAQGMPPPSAEQSILESLRSAGLTSSATVLQKAIDTGKLTLPPNGEFTIFAPSNAVLDALVSTNQANVDRVFLHHVANESLPYDMLVSLNIGTVIPTFHPRRNLLITDNIPSTYQIHGVQVQLAELCAGVPGVSCHAVDGVFGGYISPFAMPPSVPPPVPAPFLPPLPGIVLPPPMGAPTMAPASSPTYGGPGSPYAPPGPVNGAPPFTPGGPGGVGGPPATAPAPGTGAAPDALFTDYNLLKSLAAAAFVATVVHSLL